MHEIFIYTTILHLFYIVESLWSRFGVAVEPLWSHCGATVEPLWSHCSFGMCSVRI